MLSQTQKDLIVAAAVLAVFCAMLIWSAYIPDVRGREFPMLVSAAAVVLCLLDVIAHTPTAAGRAIALVLSGDAERSVPAHALPLEATAIAWVAGATALIVLAGFLAAIPVYVFAYMRLYARRSVRNAAVAAVATTVCIWAGFELLLSYELYRGVLLAG
jgi:hypothetical protein